MGGISEVVFCCWVEVSVLGQLGWMSYSVVGDIPDIFMRAGMDNHFGENDMERQWKA